MADTTPLELAKEFFNAAVLEKLTPIIRTRYGIAQHWKQYDGVWHVFNYNGSDMWHVMKGLSGRVCRPGYYSPEAREQYGKDTEFLEMLRESGRTVNK